MTDPKLIFENKYFIIFWFKYHTLSDSFQGDHIVITTKDTNTGDVTTVHFDLIKKKCQEAQW